MKCPVHMCNPVTGETLEAGSLRLCARHCSKLSLPMQQQLANALRLDEDGGAKVLEQAVDEARRNDDAWMPYALRHEERIEGHETAAEVFARAIALTSARPTHRGPVCPEGVSPVAIKSCETGKRVTLGELAAMFGPNVEHVVVVKKAHGAEVVARAETLAELLPKLRRREVLDAGREGVLLVVNAWTREEMTPAAAAARAGGRNV